MSIQNPTVHDMLYRSGDVFLPEPVRNFLQRYWIGSPKSIFYLTNWSLVHFLSGFATAYLLTQSKIRENPYWIALLIHTIWELWQIYIGMTPIRTLRGQVDTLVDTALFMAGVAVELNFFQ